MNYSKIKILLNEKRILRKEIAEKLDLTPYGWDLMLKNETMDIRTLEKLSEVLEVPVQYWFDKEGNQKNLMSEDQEKYVLYRQLDQKDKQIDFLQNYIIRKVEKLDPGNTYITKPSQPHKPKTG